MKRLREDSDAFLLTYGKKDEDFVEDKVKRRKIETDGVETKVTTKDVGLFMPFEAMNIINSNCRVMTGSLIVHELLDLCKWIRPAILYLMKTRSQKE